MIAIQYLENTPETTTIHPRQAAAKLNAAFERLPIQRVILGWALPAALVEVCAQICAQQGAELFYWQPLLSGDGVLKPQPAWRAIGLQDEPVPGFRGLPEFTFLCPNRPGLLTAIQARIENILSEPSYAGIFLDRMRYPSPAEHPGRWLACFCPDCQRTAAAQGLDLLEVKNELNTLLQSRSGAADILTTLLHPNPPEKALTTLLRAFQDFRQSCITNLIEMVCQKVQAAGRRVGLDCFAPSLTGLVAQDLGRLAIQAQWVKPMLYTHTLGPAGLPFELLALADWLTGQYELSNKAALALLAHCSGLPLPTSRDELANQGLPENVLAHELQRARLQSPDTTLLAGIELVEMPGVTHVHPNQLRADLKALKNAGADGLLLSWDLWHMPLSYLEIVQQEWL